MVFERKLPFIVIAQKDNECIVIYISHLTVFVLYFF
jgi:hypothetical protein